MTACDGQVAERRVLLDEARQRPLAEAQQVVEHEHLAVAAGARADADRRDLELAADALRDRRGHGLEHEQERAGGLGGVGVVQQAQRRLGGLALGAVAALRGRGLRRQPEVGDDRDAGAGQRADAREHRARALELDGVGGGLLEEPPGGAQGVLVAHLVRHERQVGDDERRAGRRARPPRSA